MSFELELRILSLGINNATMLPVPRAEVAGSTRLSVLLDLPVCVPRSSYLGVNIRVTIWLTRVCSVFRRLFPTFINGA